MKRPFDPARRIIESRIKAPFSGSLLDYLAGRFTYKSRAEWLAAFDRNELDLNGRTAGPEDFLHPGDTVAFHPASLPEPEARLDYSILFEDEFFLAVDKPGNLAMHPAGPYFKHTLWYLLSEKYGDIHPVNRLDRETSGVVLAAKDPRSAAELAKAPKLKRYLALVHGELTQAVDARGFLIPDAHSKVRKKLRFTSELPDGCAGKSADTRFIPLHWKNGCTLVEARPGSGRMHQIRATLHSLGFPLVGDKLYGPDENVYLRQRGRGSTPEDAALLGMERQALHAWRLSFNHPRTGRPLELTAPVPEDFKTRFDPEDYLPRP